MSRTIKSTQVLRHAKITTQDLYTRFTTKESPTRVETQITKTINSYETSKPISKNIDMDENVNPGQITHKQNNGQLG